MNIFRIKTTSSTNFFLKELSKKQTLEEWTVIVSESQTAGRGRNGNSWESESGKNITCSILLYPNFLPIKQHFLLTKIISLSLKKLLDQYIPTKKDVTIKWPNDLYYKDKKIAGVLIENELINEKFFQTVVGIGLNVNQEIFLEYTPNPISLKQIIGKETDVNDLLNHMIKQIRVEYEQLRTGDYKSISRAYHQSLYHKEKLHIYRDKNDIFRAKIQSVGEDGLLNLIDEKKEKRSYVSKEVSLLRD